MKRILKQIAVIALAIVVLCFVPVFYLLARRRGVDWWLGESPLARALKVLHWLES